MRDYTSMVKRGEIYLTKAINHPNENDSEINYHMADAFCEGVAMALGVSRWDVWEDIRSEAEKHMLEKVANGDKRAQTRWDNFWN